MPRSIEGNRSVAAVGALAAFLGLCAYLMFYRDDLVGIDFAYITAHRVIPMVMNPASGRFFPLALQEFNLLRPFGQSAALYHAFASVEMAIVAACAWRFLAPAPPMFRSAAIALTLSAPGIASSFFGIVYVERDMILWLALWLVCVDAFRRSGSRWAFWGALAAAQSLLYHKETAFIFVGGFAAATLVADHARITAALSSRQLAALWAQCQLELSLLLLCAGFVAVYLTVIAPHVTARYAVGTGSVDGAWRALMYFARANSLLVLAIAVFVARVIAWLRGKRPLDMLWDPLMAGALAFAAGYVYLGLARPYYLAPADFAAGLYVARAAHGALPAHALRAVQARRRFIVIATSAAAALMFVWHSSVSASLWLARRMPVDTYMQLATFLAEDPRASSRPLMLYFPQPGGFQVTEFGAYLEFRGWRTTHGPGSGAVSPTFVLKSPREYPRNRCPQAESIECFPAAAPESGDLVILLPGRTQSPEENARWRSAGEEILHAEPRQTNTVKAVAALAALSYGWDGPAEARVFRIR